MKEPSISYTFVRKEKMKRRSSKVSFKKFLLPYGKNMP